MPPTQPSARLQAFVRSLYVPTSEEGLRKTILSELLKIVPGRNAVINSMHLGKRTILPAFSTHPFSISFLEGTRHLIHEHPTFRDLRKRPPFSERLISDFLSRTEWHRTSLYNEAFRTERFEDQMGVGVCRSGPTCTGVAIFREKRDFSAGDRRCMSTLAPHFEQAFDNVRALEKLRASLHRRQVESNAVPGGTIWLDHRFRVVEVNRSAALWCPEFFPNERGAPRLPKLLQEWLLRIAGPTPKAPTLNPLTCLSSEARLMVRWIPCLEQKAHLLILERRALRPTLESLRPLSMTPRESNVLLWVAQGKTNEEISRILGGSRRTIDKHVQNILVKLKLENRAAAILLVADLLLA
jgi:DNA-binding CsgD family transcriptional regulator